VVVKNGWQEKDSFLERLALPERIMGHMRAVTSDDGWECPHCGHKETTEDQEMGMDEYLKHMNGETIEDICQECDKTYWLKARVIIKYKTSSQPQLGSEDAASSDT
jgi:uncharacterized protein with PIN domain